MAEPPATSLDDADPDQILNDWTLTAVDLEEIGRARGPDNRLWMALHLCSLRRTGRFTDTPETVPQGAVAHLARQLAIVPPAQLALLDRQPTDSAIRARVRDHLGFVPFSLAAQNRLETELAGMASDGLGGTDLLRRAEAILYAAKIVLPAASTLERLVASINRQALTARPWRVCMPASLPAFPHLCATPSTSWPVS
jgi:hypothetical protein